MPSGQYNDRLKPIGTTTWTLTVPVDTAIVLYEQFGVHAQAGRLDVTVHLDALDEFGERRFLASLGTASWNGGPASIPKGYQRGGKISVEFADDHPMVALNSVCKHFVQHASDLKLSPVF